MYFSPKPGDHTIGSDSQKLGRRCYFQNHAHNEEAEGRPASHAREQERLFRSRRPPAGHAREQERPFRSRRPAAGHAREPERLFCSRRPSAGLACEQERPFCSRRPPAGLAREPKRLFCSRRAWHLVHIRLLTYFTGVLSGLLAAVPMNEYSLANIFVKIIRDKWELLL